MSLPLQAKVKKPCRTFSSDLWHPLFPCTKRLIIIDSFSGEDTGHSCCLYAGAYRNVGIAWDYCGVSSIASTSSRKDEERTVKEWPSRTGILNLEVQDVSLSWFAILIPESRGLHFAYIAAAKFSGMKCKDQSHPLHQQSERKDRTERAYIANMLPVHSFSSCERLGARRMSHHNSSI